MADQETTCAVCGLPIIQVASHSSFDCAIEGTTWMHDAEAVPDGVDPCAAYDADDDHEGVPSDGAKVAQPVPLGPEDV